MQQVTESAHELAVLRARRALDGARDALRGGPHDPPEQDRLTTALEALVARAMRRAAAAGATPDPQRWAAVIAAAARVEQRNAATAGS